MSKILFAFGLGFMVIFAIGSIWIGITATTANLVQAQANATQATTGFVDKCLNGFLFVLVLLAGIAIGTVGAQLRLAVQRTGLFTRKSSGNWVSGPNAHWQRLNAPAQRQLPIYHNQLPEHQQVLVVSDEEESDFSLQGWGF